MRTVLPKDPAPGGQFDAILYNLDDVPREERSVLLEELRLGKPHSPTAVHGYDLTDEQVRTLGQSGVAAARRLSADLVRSLCRAARERRENVPPGACGSRGSGQGDLNLQTSVKGFRIRCVSTHGS